MTLALFALVVWLAVVVEATAGFGATVVTVTLASNLLPLPDVLAAFVPVNFVLSAYLVGRYRKEVDRGLLFRTFLPLMGAGMIAGTALFQLAEQAWLRTTFALFVVALSAVELLRARTPTHADAGPPPPAARVVALLGAGVIHGLFACGGPMLVYVAGRTIPDKGRFRATVSAVWLSLNVFLLASYRAAGTLGAESLKTSALLLGALLLGVPVGEWVHQRIPAARFRVAVFGLLLVAGGAQLARGLLAG